MPSKKGKGKLKGALSLPIRQQLPFQTVPLRLLPEYDPVTLQKEKWELKKGELFEDPAGKLDRNKTVLNPTYRKTRFDPFLSIDTPIHTNTHQLVECYF